MYLNSVHEEMTSTLRFLFIGIIYPSIAEILPNGFHALFISHLKPN